MAAAGKSFEVRIADLVRLFGSESEGEVLSVHGALKRLLASRSVGFTDLGNAIEKLATGAVSRRPKCSASTTPGTKRASRNSVRRQADEQAFCGQRLDGTHRLGIDRDLLSTREDASQTPKHHQFVDDMAARMAWSRAPTEKQGKYLLSRVPAARREDQR